MRSAILKELSLVTAITAVLCHCGPVSDDKPADSNDSTPTPTPEVLPSPDPTPSPSPTPEPPPTPSGAYDSTFGDGGRQSFDFGAGNTFHASAGAIQADGKLVVAGTVASKIEEWEQDFGVVRLNTDGSLDATFGVGGKAVFDFDGRVDILADLVVQPDGKILTIGTREIPSYLGDVSLDAILIRLKSDGSADPDFGTNGKVSIYDSLDGTAGAEPNFIGRGMALDGDQIVVVGGAAVYNYAGGTDDYFTSVVLKLQSDGTRDSTFDGDGMKGFGTVISTSDIYTFLRRTTAESGGNILTYNGSAILRIGSDGAVLGQRAGCNYGSYHPKTDREAGFVRLADGKILAGVPCYDSTTTTNYPVAVRLNADLSIDGEFKISDTPGTDPSSAKAGAIFAQDDERTVILFSVPPTSYVARYDNKGVREETFGADGGAVKMEGLSMGGLLKQSDGNIVVYGTKDGGGFVARLTK